MAPFRRRHPVPGQRHQLDRRHAGHVDRTRAEKPDLIGTPQRPRELWPLTRDGELRQRSSVEVPSPRRHLKHSLQPPTQLRRHGVGERGPQPPVLGARTSPTSRASTVIPGSNTRWSTSHTTARIKQRPRPPSDAHAHADTNTRSSVSPLQQAAQHGGHARSTCVVSCQVGTSALTEFVRGRFAMPTTNGRADGEIRRVPDTFKLADWPRNCWYAVAYDVELKRELVARTVAGRKLVLYRLQDGQPVALENACWHRLMPLSEGTLEGDRVACGYHGLVYNAEGRCVFMPSQKTINPAARVRAFPVVERHRFVWVWTGEPALADPGLVPDMHWNDDPEWAGDGRRIHLQCGYKLIVDNLMDLTHETFVHGASIGQRSITEVPFEVTHGTKSATVTRWMRDVDAPPFWAMQLEWKHGKPAGKVDRWQIIHFEAPSTVAIDVGVAPAGSGAPEGDRSEGVNGFVLNTMTPETERTCHYLWAFVRNYRLEDQRITTLIREGVSGVFGEDEAVLAAQQQGVDDHPDKEFYNLNIDAGAMWARRLIDRMMAAEDPDARYAESAAESEREVGTETRVEATQADAERLGVSPV